MRNTDLGLPGPRNGGDVLTLLKQPCQGNLSGRRIVLLAKRADGIDNLEDLGEVLPRVPRDHSTEVILLKVVRGFLNMPLVPDLKDLLLYTYVLTRQQPSAERRVSDDGDAELPGSPEEVCLWTFDVKSKE